MNIYHEACFSNMAITEEANLQRQHIGVHLRFRAHPHNIHLGNVM